MRRWSGIITGLLLVAALGVLAGGVALYSGNLRLQVVTSGSMRPTISPGDVAVTTPIPIDTLAVGDVIAFFPPGDGRPVLHRIATLEPDPAGPLITTKGDANNVDDPWHATLRGDTAYRLVAVVPFVGFLAEVRGAILIAAAVLIALVLIRGIWKEARQRKRPSAA